MDRYRWPPICLFRTWLSATAVTTFDVHHNLDSAPKLTPRALRRRWALRLGRWNKRSVPTHSIWGTGNGPLRQQTDKDQRTLQGIRPISKSFPPRRRTSPRAATATATDTRPNTLTGNRGRLRLVRVDRAELRRGGRRNRHPARAVLAHLARSRMAATNADLAAVLGVSRAESVPNFTRRLAAWLATAATVREQLRGLGEELEEAGAFGISRDYHPARCRLRWPE